MELASVNSFSANRRANPSAFVFGVGQPVRLILG
jgi:hypothetical protein